MIANDPGDPRIERAILPGHTGLTGGVLPGRVLGDERTRLAALVDQLVRPWIERAILPGRREVGLRGRHGECCDRNHEREYARQDFLVHGCLLGS